MTWACHTRRSLAGDWTYWLVTGTAINPAGSAPVSNVCATVVCVRRDIEAMLMEVLAASREERNLALRTWGRRREGRAKLPWELEVKLGWADVATRLEGIIRIPGLIHLEGCYHGACTSCRLRNDTFTTMTPGVKNGVRHPALVCAGLPVDI